MLRLIVVPFFFAEPEALLPPLCARLEQVFRAAAAVRPPGFDPELAHDSARGQYNSRALLAALLETTALESDRILGVTDVDLFIPVLTYVFGEAQLDGRASVVSTRRLRQEGYGMPPDPGLLHRRLVKESVHELGHTFGLLHCHDDSCVMRSSTVVEEIDLKSERFCTACVSRLPHTAARRQ